MALIDIWVNKINDKDVVDADDINNIASAVINIENQEQSIVKTTEQTFTNEQKAQARANIGAVSTAEAQTALQNLATAIEPLLLPSATTADNDKFLQVVDGKAAWVTIQLAEDGGF